MLTIFLYLSKNYLKFIKKDLLKRDLLLSSLNQIIKQALICFFPYNLRLVLKTILKKNHQISLRVYNC